MNKLRQTTLGFVLMALLATIILPSTILLWPQKTEAQGSCITGIISNLFGRLGGMLGGMGGTVPVSDSTTRANTQKTSGYTGGSFVSDCIIKPLVKNLVKQLIHSFLTSIVDWINDGFDGSGPRFVSNPAKFFEEIADRAIGQVVMGTDLNFLCSPFALDVRIALGLNYGWGGGGGFRERITCTLSDIIGNLTPERRTAYRNSWQSWLDLTTQPQNNPYGAYALAKSQIEINIANQQFVAGKEADWGAGFLTTKRCVQEDTSEDANYLADNFGVDPCLRYETVTPGKTIQEGLSKSLGAEVDEYVAAEDLDAIFGALMNQLIGSAFKATGLFSGGRNNPNYYRDQFRRQVAAGTFNTYKPPTVADNGAMGFVSCNDPTDLNYIQNYTLSANDTVVMFFDKTRTPPAWKDITNKSKPFVADPNQARVIDYQQAQNYCAQNPSWQAAQATIDNLENSITTQSNYQCSQQSKLYSTDFRPPTASNFDLDMGGNGTGGGPDLAIDGSSLTYARVQGGWLEFILNKPEVLSYINIQARESSQPFRIGTTINFYENLTSAPLSISKTLTSDVVSFTPNVPSPIKIQKIRIVSANNIFVSELTLNRYVNPIINWVGTSPKVNEPFDVLGGVTATKCIDNTALPNSMVSFVITTSPSGATPYTIDDPTKPNLITFHTAGSYTITYTVDDGIASATFTRDVVVRN